MPSDLIQEMGYFDLVVSPPPAFDDLLSKVPFELRDKDTWVVWKSTPSKNGKPRKIPFNPKTGKAASTTDPTTWGSFFDASKAYREKTPNYQGLGFVFNGDGIAGIDLDDCHNKETGEIDEWALDEINSMGSYTEFSPSGTGFHILVKSDLQHTGVNNGSVEIYTKERFFTFTGKLYDPAITTIEECTEQHQRLYEEYKPAVSECTLTPVEPDYSAITDTDKALCRRIADSKQGEKFTDLFKGEWEKYYPSQSEADSAFLYILAFWCNKNSKQMDRIVRSSKLYRDKWDSKRGNSTYGQDSIARAVAGCQETVRTSHSVKQCTSNIVKKAPPEEKAPEQKKIHVTDISDFLQAKFPPRENILPPWLPRQGLCMVHAYRGVGKTHFSLGVACAVATASKFLKWQVEKPTGVIFIDGEMPGVVLQERFAKTIAGMDGSFDNVNLKIITPDLQELGMPDLATSEGQMSVEPYITDDIGLVVLDNISTLCGSVQENKSDTWRPMPLTFAAFKFA